MGCELDLSWVADAAGLKEPEKLAFVSGAVPTFEREQLQPMSLARDVFIRLQAALQKAVLDALDSAPPSTEEPQLPVFAYCTANPPSSLYDPNNPRYEAMQRIFDPAHSKRLTGISVMQEDKLLEILLRLTDEKLKRALVQIILSARRDVFSVIDSHLSFNCMAILYKTLCVVFDDLQVGYSMPGKIIFGNRALELYGRIVNLHSRNITGDLGDKKPQPHGIDYIRRTVIEPFFPHLIHELAATEAEEAMTPAEEGPIELLPDDDAIQEVSPDGDGEEDVDVVKK